MALFDLSAYRLRQLDPAQGVKPLDFGGGGITGSINTDGRFIAINTYHPEYGYMTLTSIPPFPDEDRYDQSKVRAYRKSLVSNEGFGLAFEQEIVKRDYFLIEDAVPFMRFTLADGTVAECITATRLSMVLYQWRFSQPDLTVKFTGKVWLQRAAYTQLTEGGVIYTPDKKTDIEPNFEQGLVLSNSAIESYAFLDAFSEAIVCDDGSVDLNQVIVGNDRFELMVQVAHEKREISENFDRSLKIPLDVAQKSVADVPDKLVVRRAHIYANICRLVVDKSVEGMYERTLLTDHMILPLAWHRDAYYITKIFPDKATFAFDYLRWLFQQTWRGTYCKSQRTPMANAWGRSYMANGQQKDSRSYQLDQQIFPLILIADFYDHLSEMSDEKAQKSFQEGFESQTARVFSTLFKSMRHIGLFVTDETPADDDIPLPYHFSSHVLLWHALKRLIPYYDDAVVFTGKSLPDAVQSIFQKINEHFITEHNGKKTYSYATDGEGNYYLYHDANDIPLVMMPLWGFCDKDDELWLNTIEFAFSDANPGFYDGVLGSVHTPAPWALGDAQELIFCKVIGDKARYQRVWQRVEKAAQWDGALPEAYDAKTGEVVSRHWFAWTNAMIAIADGISWNWETEGEYAR